ncbi:hypothetical protein EYF80_059907 [Liparis tanakae]|uniref:Uncharacterized protein n=1 Tax=Liparis tanakae TaxID=230148 RepID=A0A4Z2EN91_9TELE|nr:hypothetical protein EYF80_059907 [Liparis tanakae]
MQTQEQIYLHSSKNKPVHIPSLACTLRARRPAMPLLITSVLAPRFTAFPPSMLALPTFGGTPLSDPLSVQNSFLPWSERFVGVTEALPPSWIQGDSKGLSGPLRFPGGGDEGLPVVLVSIHTDNLVDVLALADAGHGGHGIVGGVSGVKGNAENHRLSHHHQEGRLI